MSSKRNPSCGTRTTLCRSDAWDCENCYDSWAHLTWIMLNVEQHLGSKEDFTNWLTTTYMFHLASRIGDYESAIKLFVGNADRSIVPSGSRRRSFGNGNA